MYLLIFWFSNAQTQNEKKYIFVRAPNGGLVRALNEEV